MAGNGDKFFFIYSFHMIKIRLSNDLHQNTRPVGNVQFVHDDRKLTNEISIVRWKWHAPIFVCNILGVLIGQQNQRNLPAIFWITDILVVQ